MNIYQPYTYLIGWSYLNKFYYGAEYGFKTKIANPANLWTTYFTSSSIVQEYRYLFGEPDIIQIRKIFKTADETTAWESKLLRRISAAKSDMWLNANVSGSFEKCNNNGNRKPRTARQIESAKKSLTATMARRKYGTFYGRKHTNESIEKMRKPKEKVSCPHCGKIGGAGRMKVWHFDNCKTLHHL